MDPQHALNAVKRNDLTRFSFQIPSEAAKLLKLISDKRSISLKELGVALVDISEPGNLNGEIVLMPDEEVIKKELAIIQALTSNTKPNFNYLSSSKRRLDEDIDFNQATKRICQYNINNQFHKPKSEIPKTCIKQEVTNFKVPQPIISKNEQPISKLKCMDTLEGNLNSDNTICHSIGNNFTDINKSLYKCDFKSEEDKKLNISNGQIFKNNSDNLVSTSVPILNGTQTISSLIRSFDQNCENQLFNDITDEFYGDHVKSAFNHKYKEYKYSSAELTSENDNNCVQNFKRPTEQKNLSPLNSELYKPFKKSPDENSNVNKEFWVDNEKSIKYCDSTFKESLSKDLKIQKKYIPEINNFRDEESDLIQKNYPAKDSCFKQDHLFNGPATIESHNVKSQEIKVNEMSYNTGYNENSTLSDLLDHTSTHSNSLNKPNNLKSIDERDLISNNIISNDFSEKNIISTHQDNFFNPVNNSQFYSNKYKTNNSLSFKNVSDLKMPNVSSKFEPPIFDSNEKTKHEFNFIADTDKTLNRSTEHLNVGKIQKFNESIKSKFYEQPSTSYDQEWSRCQDSKNEARFLNFKNDFPKYLPFESSSSSLFPLLSNKTNDTFESKHILPYNLNSRCPPDILNIPNPSSFNAKYASDILNIANTYYPNSSISSTPKKDMKLHYMQPSYEHQSFKNGFNPHIINSQLLNSQFFNSSLTNMQDYTYYSPFLPQTNEHHRYTNS